MPPRRGFGKVRASLRRLSARSRSSPSGGRLRGHQLKLELAFIAQRTGQMFSVKNR